MLQIPRTLRTLGIDEFCNTARGITPDYPPVSAPALRMLPHRSTTRLGRSSEQSRTKSLRDDQVSAIGGVAREPTAARVLPSCHCVVHVVNDRGSEAAEYR